VAVDKISPWRLIIVSLRGQLFKKNFEIIYRQFNVLWNFCYSNSRIPRHSVHAEHAAEWVRDNNSPGSTKPWRWSSMDHGIARPPLLQVKVKFTVIISRRVRGWSTLPALRRADLLLLIDSTSGTNWHQGGQKNAKTQEKTTRCNFGNSRDEDATDVPVACCVRYSVCLSCGRLFLLIRQMAPLRCGHHYITV